MKGIRISIVVGVLLLALIMAALPFAGACASAVPPEEEAPPPPSEGEAPPAAPEWEPPKLITWTCKSIKTGTTQRWYGVFSTVQDRTGVIFRLEPSELYQAKVLMVRQKVADIIATPIMLEYWDIAMGTGIYEDPEWGPAPFRILWKGGPAKDGIAVRADSGIMTLADLRGKRVPTMAAARDPEADNLAALRFANLTWDDVKVVPLTSYAESRTALIEGTIDATFMALTTAKAYELEASPHGIRWLPLPHSDTEGWARANEICPHWYPVVAEEGPGISKEQPLETFAKPQAAIIAEWADDELVYFIVKNIAESYNQFKDKHPDLPYFTLDEAVNNVNVLCFPYHPGAIKYFKEVGLWGDEQQQWQEMALARLEDWEEAWMAKYVD